MPDAALRLIEGKVSQGGKVRKRFWPIQLPLIHLFIQLHSIIADTNTYLILITASLRVLVLRANKIDMQDTACV
ncbi:hypothetical protein TcasGA2_TC004162 [Tribolium castaneum]|uniref:Uncharacterized protein n=1 Tax=Tribolium castaneum TaxID=7070 RepID=D6W6S3_TRICA|nr:hypothetical protein TcasGA2_TC004162 [Tribolium castaneum]